MAGLLPWGFDSSALRFMPTEVFNELAGILTRHDIIPRGVIHVGANRGQEVPAYRELFPRIKLVEPNPELPLPDDCEVIRKAVGGEYGEATLYIPKWDQAASVLRPVKRRVIRKLTVPVVPLRDIQGSCNVLVVDVQGAELEVLKSGDLERFDLIVVEVFPTRRYEGACVREEVMDYLAAWELAAEFPHKVPTVSDLVYVR